MADIREELKRIKCGILIPTYNNDGTVATVAQDALKYCYDVYVVNDGCTDNTLAELAKVENIHVVGYEKNQGKGVALKTGMKAMVEAGFDFAITLDADGQHKVEDIPLLIQNIGDKKNILVAGVRNVYTQEGMPAKNGFANKFSNFWFKVETGIDFPDTQCGMRLYPIAEMAKHHYFSTKYEFELEVLVRSVWQGTELIAQPIHVYYPPAEERVTHFRPFQDFSRISVLNTILVTIALLYIKPRDFFRQLSWSHIKKLFDEHIVHTKYSDSVVATSVGLGVTLGILPIWGAQMIVALALAQVFKLSRTITVLCSNVSIFPLTPFVLWASYAIGSIITGGHVIPKFDFESFSLDNFKNTLATDVWQYFIGACILAIFCGLLTGIITYGILKRKK